MSEPNTDPIVVTPAGAVDLEDPKVKEAIAAAAEKLAEERLKPIKTNLDNAFAARDAEKAAREKLEAAARETEIKRLTEEGKHREAYELQLAEERRLRTAAENKTVELTRDSQLRAALGSVPVTGFRNSNAQDMAFKELVSSLVRNDKGEWVHSSGISIQTFVKQFSENQENAFLFKQLASTGGGSGGLKPAPAGDGKVTSVFALSQDEVLKRAAEGTLPPRRK